MVINRKLGHPKHFLDSLRLFVKAGNGGNGFPKYGGVGGKGGDVYMEGFKDFTLNKTKKNKLGKHWKAEGGESSRHHKVFGEAGNDLIIPAPTGTVVKTDIGYSLGEMMVEGDRVLVARGGEGGHKENGFIGQRGEHHHIRLLLKLIADVGLVGFPNAGKSTLLRAVSSAKPKVASYPFTTLHPTVGTMKYGDSRQITVADLPGLIEGAWKNTGMGHSFLRHVERTKLLLFVVDVEGFRLGPEYPQRSPIENVILLNRELELYQPELVEKPAMLIVNKMDKEGSGKVFEKLEEQLRDIQNIAATLPEEIQPQRYVSFSDVIPCSAKYRPLDQIKDKIRTAIDEIHASDFQDSEDLQRVIDDQLYGKTMKLL